MTASAGGLTLLRVGPGEGALHRLDPRTKIAALVVLMLSEEHPQEGANMTQFITRPARHRPKRELVPGRALTSENRPEDLLQDAIVLEPEGQPETELV